MLAVRDSAHIPETGGTILISGENLTIAGLLKYDPFHDDGLTHGKVTLITSDETFIRLTGTEDYALLNIQLTDDAGEEDIKAIRRTAGEEYEFYDRRGQNTAGTYAAFVFCVYAFLIIITLVAVLNIINSISMSTASRARQYGMMRAVGMEGRQITKMIAAEAFTYAFCGCAAGCAAGLPVSRFLYGILITDHFPYAVWHLPLRSLSVIILTVSLAAAAAALLPASGIRKTSVTRTISEL